ncbi:isoprenylcysteine carboxylmethyltransferase family protein [Antarcticibacterium arcticum]|uniref:Isoprenylcysteine carboxylmethyltransferase family protein n=1 Tax=Antarcticibacterium arcticum TaxID=2585771 RepID=A0A5B8YKF2_9FLAO|nr:isoprenylcysteine carboxylmethyltransferase family protein [Antarcticibacterium arcticum]QED37327.1 isoprenylcysteine carboxylmethyltransferase family protein [Antarcticibacterium arcticum]
MKNPAADFVFVGLQIVLFAAYIPNFTLFELSVSDDVTIINLILALGGLMIIIISLLQLNKNLTIFPSPKKEGELVTSGLFKYMRHPIYSGILIATFFFALYSQSGYRLVIFLLLAILFYYKSQYEERALIKKFPQYESYRAGTGRFFPKL